MGVRTVSQHLHCDVTLCDSAWIQAEKQTKSQRKREGDVDSRI